MFGHAKDGRVPTDILMDEEKSPEDRHRAVDLLVAEEYLRDCGDYFEITYKGKMFIHDGGFFRQDRRKRILAYCTVVAAVASVLALAVSVIALVCQMHG